MRYRILWASNQLGSHGSITLDSPYAQYLPSLSEYSTFSASPRNSPQTNRSGQKPLHSHYPLRSLAYTFQRIQACKPQDLPPLNSLSIRRSSHPLHPDNFYIIYIRSSELQHHHPIHFSPLQLVTFEKRLPWLHSRYYHANHPPCHHPIRLHPSAALPFIFACQERRASPAHKLYHRRCRSGH